MLEVNQTQTWQAQGWRGTGASGIVFGSQGPWLAGHEAEQAYACPVGVSCQLS